MDTVVETGLHCTACESTDVGMQHVHLALWHGERLVVVEGIPALVCRRCGEQFYDDGTTIGLDLLRGNGFPPEHALRTIEVPVFDFGDVPAMRNVR